MVRAGQASSLWTDHGAPVDAALAQPAVGLLDAVQGEALDVGADLAGPGEVKDLHQLNGRAPVRNGELRLERKGPKAELEGSTGEADNGHVALEASDLGPQGERVVRADVVEHQLGAKAGSEPFDLLGRGVLAGLDRLIGADLARQRELVGATCRRR